MFDKLKSLFKRKPAEEEEDDWDDPFGALQANIGEWKHPDPQPAMVYIGTFRSVDDRGSTLTLKLLAERPTLFVMDYGDGTAYWFDIMPGIVGFMDGCPHERGFDNEEVRASE